MMVTHLIFKQSLLLHYNFYQCKNENIFLCVNLFCFHIQLRFIFLLFEHRAMRKCQNTNTSKSNNTPGYIFYHTILFQLF